MEVNMYTVPKVSKFDSSDGMVSKFVFQFSNDAVTESVLYRYPTYKDRTVICCSVQSGCRVGCKFCGTGKFFKRNLSKDEIIYQVNYIIDNYVCMDELDTIDISKFQIMFMSMGEPMHNIDELVASIYELNNLYSNADLLISTSAPIELNNSINRSKLIEVSKNVPRVGLQFSIHESTNERRRVLIPTETLDLLQISKIGEEWAKSVGRQPFFNYCVHNNNSSIEDADRLCNIFDPKIWQVTLSVICNANESMKSSIDRQLDIIRSFNNELLNRGYSTRVFNPAGQDDIGGGCGQLWYFQKYYGLGK